LANGVAFEQLSSPTRVVGPGIDTSNDTGIWLLQKDGFKLGVREGDRAPGTADSVVFSTREVGFETLVFSGTGVVQNKSEQFAFMGYLSGPGVTDANDVGLWASHRDGELQLIAREGQELDIDDGPGVDMRTIGSISTRTFDATGQFLNDRGQVLFWATFTDGSKGLFLSDLVAVPEPCCFTLVATLAAVLCEREKAADA
jgi:hypothetical protein